MKNYMDSDYALNKHSDGIVYRFADEIVEYTMADYLAENPNKTESDYHELKELSDSIYLEQVQNENAQTYKNSPYDELGETALCQSPSPEEILICEIDEGEEAEQRQELMAVVSHALDKLTKAQRRRYLLHKVDGMTTRDIGDKEDVSHVAIVYSLELAEKKIKKFLDDREKGLTKTT